MSKFAKRMHSMEKSAAVIRNLFGAMNDPEVISFSGGAIAQECLPVEIIHELTQDIMQREGRGVEALSYGPVMGVKDLREVVVSDLVRPKGVKLSVDNAMILSGGLEAMNLMCQVFIDPGDIILVESPTFVHSIEIFDMFQARCIAVETDENGMNMEDLEAKIKKYNPKMMYLIPTFQNPTGITLSLDRRKKAAQLASEYDIVLLEDDPYRDIRYNGVELPPVKAFDTTGHVVMANSFSKIFSPGSRLGYLVANERIINKLADAKSATNSHTSILPQIICAEFFKKGHYQEHHRNLCAVHRIRRDTMLDAIDRYFPEGTRRTQPDGGLFTWAELPKNINTTELLVEATTNPEVKVAYVAGEGFFTEGGGKGRNCMRLSFGAVPPEKIREGMAKLGKLLQTYESRYSFTVSS
ncbi:aminotransferase-like domain-containing protein [Tindallia californiensis]|uniref:2-aminoadipate transaminase n=1 Tax=Tindallia californiensis TaxID=159292 RepID=A0A1H3IZT5_9FIRM|nr:PLP-dependent aminotransferase family protein [Tindallia californiensis]SDY33162.1 2-aminoadipate transaminase [Tindallia californiensis]